MGRFLGALATGLGCICATALPAQGPVAWLRYAIPPDPPRYHDMPHVVSLLGDASGQASPEEQAAADELDRGLGHMVAGTDTLLHRFDPRADAIILGTTDAIRRSRIPRIPGWTDQTLPEEGFRVVHLRRGARQWWVLQGGSPRAELYAAYRFAAMVAEDQQLPNEMFEPPAVGLRAVEIEGDASTVLDAAAALLPDTAPVRNHLAAAAVLGRLLASVKINAIVVDADSPATAPLAEGMRPFGIRVMLRTVDAARLGAIAAQGAAMQNFGGIALQSAADALSDVAALNAAARTLRSHGASLVLRDALGASLRNGPPTNLTPEKRAAALHGLEPNVVLAGDLVSPLLPFAGLGSANFGLLPGTPQVAQIPLVPGHMREVIYPLPGWLHAFATEVRGTHRHTTLLEALEASPRGGILGEITATDFIALLQQPLLQANLFAFGQIGWGPAVGAGGITESWARQTWGDDARVFGVAMGILLASEGAVRNNGSPFGMISLASPEGGPDPARVAAQVTVGRTPVVAPDGLGVDRTATGTNEIGRYAPELAAELGDPGRCPEEWLLAVHRVPPTHAMANGKTVVQNFYDVHFTGAAEQANSVDAWEATQPLVDAVRYRAVHSMLEKSAHHAEIWRDATTEWMARATGVPDATGFVGNRSGRVEAESMTLEGFTRKNTTEREDASGGAYAACSAISCTAATEFHGETNVYRIETGYFNGTAGTLTLKVNGAKSATWTTLATASQPGGSTAERFVLNGVRLKQGDHVEITGTTGSTIDFLEITRDPRWN